MPTPVAVLTSCCFQQRRGPGDQLSHILSNALLHQLRRVGAQVFDVLAVCARDKHKQAHRQTAHAKQEQGGGHQQQGVRLVQYVHVFLRK